MVVATAPQPAIVGRYSVFSPPGAPRLTDPPTRRPSINATNGTVGGQPPRNACGDDKLSL